MRPLELLEVRGQPGHLFGDVGALGEEGHLLGQALRVDRDALAPARRCAR